MGEIFGQIGYLFNVLFTIPIFNGLMLLNYVFNDFGLSIIVLTLIIKLVLFPLTLKQLKSMKATQALQPQMAEIRKKYKNDQQGQALAMQALYKEYGVNPAAGCFPLLIQMPVLYGLFFALNQVLGKANLVHINSMLYPFVPHLSVMPNLYLDWFTFLNPAFTIPLNEPDRSHILPILAGIATFIQLRMSQPKVDPKAPSDPATQSTRMMQYFMPLLTVFFGWTFAAGLALYWTVSSVFQAVQQYFVTGWGSLLIKPDLKKALPAISGASNDTKVVEAKSNGRKRETQVVEEDGESETEDDEDGESESRSDGPIESRMRTADRPNGTMGGTQYNRRRRTGSASARRRGSAQKSRG